MNHAEIRGIARVDARTKNLLRRLRPSEISVIDHQDLDQVAAEGLVRARVKAVVNARPSISGRYPNLGPQILLEAGVTILDDVGTAVMEKVREGVPVEIRGASLWQNGQEIARG
ncbi:MAG: hypothetical protein GX493_03325, partial [Firmicutes bacterium]|nr:hypothetical protein [Bacillota bacterium]